MISNTRLCAVAFAVILVLAGCGRNEPVVQKEAPLTSTVSVEETSPPTVEDARDFIERLDAATKDFGSVLQKGDLPSLAKQSRRMTALMDEGRKFGTTVFDSPFGHCYAAGIHARTWWSERVAKARTGTASLQYTEKDLQTLYQEHQKRCLESVVEQQQAGM